MSEQKVRGFARMDSDRRRAVSEMGRAARAMFRTPGHRWSPNEAREAGRKGGAARAARLRERAAAQPMADCDQLNLAGMDTPDDGIDGIRVAIDAQPRGSGRAA